MGRRMISTTVYFTEEQLDRLNSLSIRTKVPVAEYIRRAADLVLSKEDAELAAMLASAGPADTRGDRT